MSITLDEYEKLSPNMKYNGLTFLTPNQHCAWRVETLDTKEPDTLAWIRNMAVGEVFFDVGSCMGSYALVAAQRGLRVHAFEPEANNFALLCRNIAINKLSELVTPWPIAISDAPSFDYFYSQTMSPGGSCNSYAQEVNFHLQPKKYPFVQGSIAMTLDDFSDKYGFPTHIKIDCDGFEHKVLAGAGACLTICKSVLVELNTHLPEHMRIYEIMEDHGLFPDVATAEIARRKEGPFKDIGNVIFYRK
jgi:FkbM family methyltransferase